MRIGVGTFVAKPSSDSSSDAAVRVLPILIANLRLQYLTRNAARQGCPELDSLGRLNASQPCFGKFDQIGVANALPGLEFHDGADRFAPFLIRHADHGAVLDGGMAGEYLFDLCGVDIESAADDHVFLAIHDEQIAVLVHVADIARVMPTE